jgi:hypothetical protein
MKRVVVHIERLVLNGFSNEDRYGVAAGLEQGLANVLANRKTVSHLGRMGNVSQLHVRGGELQQGANPQRVGESVARGIGREIVK